MTRIMILGVVLVAMGCAGTTPPAATAATPTTVQWDETASVELAAWVQSMNDAWAKGDLEAIRGFIADDAFLTSYDLDMMGKPISFQKKDDILAFAAQAFAATKQMGATIQFKTNKLDCRATGTLGACVVEMDLVANMGGKTETMSMRGTSVMHKSANGWVGTHWHASLSKVPEAPVAAAPATPAPSAAVAFNSKELAWVSPPDVPPGMKLAIVSGDPAKGAFSGLIEFPKGTSFPRHYHGASTHAYVVKGSVKITMADGRVLDLKPGAAGMIPAKAIHTTESKGGAIAYQYCDGAESTVMVDEQGNPLPPPAPATAAPAAPAAAPAAPAAATAPAK